jgi:DNA-binding MarR family transcriptional regulator
MDDREEEFEDQLLPESWGRRPKRPRMPAFAALHGACHVLNRRMTMELRDHGLSPAEAVVFETLRRFPQATIATVRQLTGLRASTLDSMLDRLVARELLVRESPRDLRGEVVLVTVGSAQLMTTYATTALRTIDEELRVYVAADIITGLETVFEGARALGVPGTATDL